MKQPNQLFNRAIALCRNAGSAARTSPRSEGADFAKAWQTDSADAASETRGCAVGASKAANASPSSDIPILLAAGNPNMDRQRYCRGRHAGDPQSGHTPRGRGADRALSQRPDCRALDFCQFRV
jgi:hypothetical protein